MVIACETMDAKGKERGILKLESRAKVSAEGKSVLTPQGSGERPPSSPQPSVDRLSVTWADPGSMTSSVNLFHLPSETPVSNEVKFSPSAADGSEDEDYSASLSAVLRQRRASVRRSRKGRARRPSSPFLPDESRCRRRSSVFTTSSGDTAISIEDQQTVVTQEQIFENIHLHKEVLGSVKQQPLGMRRKLKIVHQAKTYIKRHEGQLQERLAQSKSTRDIYARFNILLATKWQQLKREAANTSNLLIPWELRIKEIESHFGSVVASYFTFLRWLFWVNLVIGFILLVFVIVPEYLTANPMQDGERKIIMEEERENATNLLTLWEFEGVLKCSPIFYGYYSNIERKEYRMPLAYFLTGLVVYVYSFVAILRKMAENSRMSKLSEKEDECIFSWKLFTGWDFMIGNAETAHNRIASVILGFKEALLEEAEKKKKLRNWRIISLRAIVNICVVKLLVVSAYAVVTVVSRSDDNSKTRNWWRENETTVVVTVISITFPVFFEVLGYFEHYHPRKQLRLQLARIMLLNLLNLYSLIFALFSKIEGMSKELYSLQPNLTMNAVVTSDTTQNLVENISTTIPLTCFETTVPCLPCSMTTFPPLSNSTYISTNNSTNVPVHEAHTMINLTLNTKKISNSMSNENLTIPQNLKVYDTLVSENLVDQNINTLDFITSTNSIIQDEVERLRKISQSSGIGDTNETEEIDYDQDDIINFDIDFTTETADTKFVESTIRPLQSTLEYTDINIDPTEEYTSVDVYDRDTFTDLETNSTTINDRFTIDPTTFLKVTDSYYTGTSILNDSTTDLKMEDSTDFGYLGTKSVSSEITFAETTYPTTSYTNTDTSVYYDLSMSPKTYTRPSSTGKTNLDTTTDYDGPTSHSTDMTPEYISTQKPITSIEICPNITFNCTINCREHNITQTFFMANCKIVEVKCYANKCRHSDMDLENLKRNQTNITVIDSVYTDGNNRKMYNLTVATKKKLLKLCWETMFGQELVKLTMMDLVFVLLGTLFLDFFRALFVRYMNRCWCWDLEKKFPEYGDFKIAENILHLINNQGMVWMGMFFSPGLVVLNVVKLMIMMYLRSWAVMTCNVPHEVVFRVSKSNNFYLALLLTMLFLCVLPVGYTIVWVKPSWHCGPFSEYEKIYYILTTNIYKILPKSLNFTLEYMASPAIVIPLLVLLILIIYYLTSLTNSLREANNDLKIQLRRERTEERRKMFQLADTRRRVGSSAMDNTPYARWKKALPSLPISKSIDSDDRKTMEDFKEPVKSSKKKGGIFAKIVGLAIDKKTSPDEACDLSSSPNNAEEETDTEFHESLSKEIFKINDISITKKTDTKKKSNVDFITAAETIQKDDEINFKFKLENIVNRTQKQSEKEKNKQNRLNDNPLIKPTNITNGSLEDNDKPIKIINKKQTSESSSQSKQSDSIGSVIPIITISTTESDDETLQAPHAKDEIGVKTKCEAIIVSDDKDNAYFKKKRNRTSSDIKCLQRQSSVESIDEKGKKGNEGHKYQYSL